MRIFLALTLGGLMLPLYQLAPAAAEEFKTNVQVDNTSGKAVLKRGSTILMEEITDGQSANAAGAKSVIKSAKTSPGKVNTKNVNASSGTAQQSKAPPNQLKQKMLQQKLSSNFQQAVAFQSMGMEGQAITYYELALKDDPKYLSTYNNLAMCLVARNKDGDLARASELLETANKMSPGNVNSIYGLAILKERQKDYQSAEKSYREVLKAQPFNMQALQGLSEMHYRLGNKTAAKSVIQDALNQKPPEPQAEILRQALANLEKQSASSSGSRVQ